MKPGIGLPSEPGPNCMYSRIPFGDESCDESAIVHLLIASDFWGMVKVQSCTLHAPIARHTGKVLDEHEFQIECSLGESYWSSAQKTCILKVGR